MLGQTRKLIRAGLQTTLDKITSVGSRVVAGEAEVGLTLPNITYIIDSDDFDQQRGFMTGGDYPGDREIKITIEGRALLRDGTEIPIDDLCLDIEKAIASGATLNQYCEALELQTTTYDLDENDKPIGLATLEYTGYYIEGI